MFCLSVVFKCDNPATFVVVVLTQILLFIICYQDTARRIARVSREAKIDIDEEEYVETFKPHMMDIVNAWCNGSSFAEICKMTDIFEGEDVVENRNNFTSSFNCM